MEKDNTIVGNELISVIVPVYNIIDLLPKCVKSLEAQTYRNLEIILVDDGSTDGTADLCDKLAAESSRDIRVFHKENGGSSSARNLGIMEARGSYLGFVDSDDYVEADMYEKLYCAIVGYGVDIVQTGRDEIDADGNILPNICEPPKEEVLTESEDFMRELLMHRGDCSFCTKLVAKRMFDDGKFPEGILNEDFHLLIHMLPKTKGVVSLPYQHYHVFYRIGSNSRKENKENFSRVFADNVDNSDIATDIVRENYPSLQRIVFRFSVFQRIDYMLHIPISQMDGNNGKYKEIVKYLRRNWLKSMFNGNLTLKNKLYHTLLAIAPKGVRKVHKKVKKL